MADLFSKFTQSARHVLTLAQEEAHRHSHNYIGTEHILLGLVGEGESDAMRILIRLGLDPKKIRSQVEFIMIRGDRAVLGEIGLTPRSKRVIEIAVTEARHLNDSYIGTEHILLGLVGEGEGVATAVLKKAGLSSQKIRNQIMHLRGRPQLTSLENAPLENPSEIPEGQRSALLDSTTEVEGDEEDGILSAVKDLSDEVLERRIAHIDLQIESHRNMIEEWEELRSPLLEERIRREQSRSPRT